jgi:hypothetical protein
MSDPECRIPESRRGFRKLKHVAHCFTCRVALDRLGWPEDPAMAERIRRCMMAHAMKRPFPEAPRCQHARCVFHVRVPTPVARRLLRLADSGPPFTAGGGVVLARIPLYVPHGPPDRPVFFSVIDFLHRTPGDLFLRMGPGPTSMAHVLVSVKEAFQDRGVPRIDWAGMAAPDPEKRKAKSPEQVWASLEHFESEHLPTQARRALDAFNEMLGVAELDASLER